MVGADPAHLYIYVLKGRVASDEESSLGTAFLGNWVEGEDSFLFFSRPEDERVDQLIAGHPELEVRERHHFRYEDWQGGSPGVLHVEPFLFVPPWLKAEAGEGEIKVVLDPGVVFGNGLHPTTRHCLQAIAGIPASSMGRVLDLGTGTGILALAAASMGAKAVTAVDLNPLCVKTARRNTVLNDMSGVIEVMEGKAESYFEEPADLVVANIHYEVIEKLLGERAFGPGEHLLLSGLLRSQASGVRDRLSKGGFRVLREWDQEMTWFTLLALSEP